MLSKPLAIQVIAVLALVFGAGAAQSQNPVTGTINTFAGGGNPTGLATSVPIGQPWSVIQDGAGNTYIADNHSNRIFVVNSSNTISVIAGDSADGLTSGTQTATQTSLSFPQGMAFYGGGLYIADDGNNEIRVVNVSTSPITVYGTIMIKPGEIANVAGLPGGAPCILSVTPGCGDNGLATSAGLNAPADVVVDPATGNIFIADTGDNVIREVDGSTGVISNVAGKYCDISCTGGTGDGGPALSATFDAPTWISLDISGNIYIADTNDDVIRVVNTSPTTTLTLFSGSTTPINISPLDIDSVAGTFGTACTNPGPCNDNGPSTKALLSLPGAVLVDSSSNIYIADTGNQVVREVNGGTGTISRLAGTYFTPCSPISSLANCGDGGVATVALLHNPTSVFLDTTGDVFIADELDAAIRELKSGDISTFAGIHFNRGLYGDNGPATSAEIQNPVGVAADSSGNVFIADTPSNVIRKVDTTGKITTVAGVLLSCFQSSNCGDGGPATSANLWLPSDVFADSAGNLYIADTSDDSIRMVNAQTGNISTVAGIQQKPCKPSTNCGDGGPATGAYLTGPSAVFVDSGSNIFIADTLDNAIRKIDAKTGNISTVAGTLLSPCTSPFSCGDGGLATSALLNSPSGVFVDSLGNIYIADTMDDAIRKVDVQTGFISTVAGTLGTACATPTQNVCGDGGSATSAQLWLPWSTFVDFMGNLFIADQQNDVIRVANLSPTGTTNVVGGVTIPAGDINTVVGSEQNGGFSGDSGPALSAQIHEPLGMRSDSAGNLYIGDRLNWRVREVSGIVATTPTANPSPGSLTFASQAVESSSAQQPVTVTNNGNLSPLQFTISFSGTNPADFVESDSCSGSVPGNGQTCTLNVTFKPTAAGSRSATMTITDALASIAQTVKVSGTATQATTTTKLVSSADPSNAGNSVTLTATVTPTTSGTPTGSVTFKDGSTTLSSAVNLSSGVAKLAISTLTAATHSITAVYSGDANYNGSTSTALSQVVDAPFTVNVSALSPSSTISPGGSASSTLTITSVNGFASAVSLTCAVSSSGSPAPANPPGCTVTTPVTPAANKTVTSTLTITTTAAAAALTRPSIQRPSMSFYAVWLLFPAMLLSAAGLGTPSRRKLSGKLLRYALICLTMAGGVVLVACGGGGGGSTGGGGGGGGTTAGAYTITVTATATGFSTQTAPIAVTVQ